MSRHEKKLNINIIIIEVQTLGSNEDRRIISSFFPLVVDRPPNLSSPTGPQMVPHREFHIEKEREISHPRALPTDKVTINEFELSNNNK